MEGFQFCSLIFLLNASKINRIDNPQQIFGIVSISCFANGGGYIRIHANCWDHHQINRPVDMNNRLERISIIITLFFFMVIA
jgi:hypothetical protein